MADGDPLRAAREMRRAVLGDAYVDSVTAETSPAAQEFQDHITAMAWGVWARGGPLTTRDRSLLVLAMTAALNRMDEFEIHLRSAPRAGVSDAEVDELLFQIAAYAGGPAAVASRRIVRAVRAERDVSP
jgi:4-carboxymuconolactone decarboxylase